MSEVPTFRIASILTPFSKKGKWAEYSVVFFKPLLELVANDYGVRWVDLLRALKRWGWVRVANNRIYIHPMWYYPEKALERIPPFIYIKDRFSITEIKLEGSVKLDRAFELVMAIMQVFRKTLEWGEIGAEV